MQIQLPLNDKAIMSIFSIQMGIKYSVYALLIISVASCSSFTIRSKIGEIEVKTAPKPPDVIVNDTGNSAI